MKEKRGYLLLILLLVTILVIGSYVVIMKKNDKKEVQEIAKETAESVDEVVMTTDTDSIQSITYKNQESQMTLIKEDNIWKNTADKICPINQDYAANMLSALSEITVSQTVTKKAEDLSEYGLDDPVLTASITTANKSIGLSLGNKVITEEDGYYGKIDGKDTIYVFTSYIYDTFSYSNSQMVTVEELPVISTDTISKLTVSQKDGVEFEAIKSDEDST